MREHMSFILNNFRWLGSGFVLLFASTFGQTLFISLSGQEIKSTFNLSSGEFGSIYMVVTLASAGCIAFLGSVLDSHKLPKVVLISGIMLAIGTLIMGVATNVYMLIGSLFLLRFFGQGMFVNIAFTSIGRWFCRERGRASAVVALGFNMGEALLPLAFVLVATLFNWRVAWLSAGALLLLVLLPPIIYGVKVDRNINNDTEDMAADGCGWTRKDVLSDPIFYVFLTGMVIPPMIASSLFFHQSSIATPRGWAPEVFASSLAIYAIVAMVTVLTAGSIIDRVGPLKIIPLHLFPLAIGCWTIAYVEVEWSIFVFMALYAITEPISLTLAGTLWPQVYGTRYLGAIRGVFAAALSVCTALGPGISGILIDTGIPLENQMIILGWYCIIIAPVLAWASYKATVRLQLLPMK
jgi:MFS family permease